MALAFQRNQVGLKVTGTHCSVPNNPKAKLMYYLNCMSTVLELDELPRELRDYNNYYALNDTQVRFLLDFCKLLSPDLLEGKCIFQVNDLDSGNEFLELSQAKTTMVATSSVMMAGRNIQVHKIMLYKPIWRRNNYDQPMAEVSLSLVSRPALTSSSSARRQRSSSCILL